MFSTISSYIARRYLGIALASFLTVIALILVIDIIELMRQKGLSAVGFSELAIMALMHAPTVAITVAPFTILLAAMACFGALARSSEIVIMRAAGLSVWRLLLPAVGMALLLGCFGFAVYNPVAAALASRFEILKERYSEENTSRVAVSDDGVWLRQGSKEGQMVIRARRASSNIERLWGVTIFQFDSEDQLLVRMDARTAQLEKGAWQLHSVQRWDLDMDLAQDNVPGVTEVEARSQMAASARIPTDLTVEHIQDSLAPPDTLSFWQLSDFIHMLEESGFSSVRHRMHWHRLLAMPVVFAAMVLIGAAFSMRYSRFGGLGFMALGCVLSGFGYFFLADISTALGTSGAVSVTLAAWGPPISAILFALGLLLHLEDG